MTDPTPEPTPAPAPEPVPTNVTKLISDDRVATAEAAQATALDKSATAHQRVADALAQVAEMSASPDAEMTPAWLYRDARMALLHRPDVPFDQHHMRASQAQQDIVRFAAGDRW